MSDPLYMWTVYDHPKDFPHNYVAREWAITAEGTHSTGRLIVGPTLPPLQQALEQRGLVKLMRHPSDDSVILETWL